MLFLVISCHCQREDTVQEWTFVLTQSSYLNVLNIDVIVFLILSIGNLISGAGDQPAWQNRMRTALLDGKFP